MGLYLGFCSARQLHLPGPAPQPPPSGSWALLLPPVTQIERPLCSSLKVGSNRLFIWFFICSTTMDCVSFPHLCVLEKHIMYNGPIRLYGSRNNITTMSRWSKKNRYPLLQQKWKVLLSKKKWKQLPVSWDKEPGHPDPHFILEENIARSSRVRDALLQNTEEQGAWHKWVAGCPSKCTRIEFSASLNGRSENRV